MAEGLVMFWASGLKFVRLQGLFRVTGLGLSASGFGFRECRSLRLRRSVHIYLSACLTKPALLPRSPGCLFQTPDDRTRGPKAL